MKAKHFINKLEEKRIVAAIAEAERKSSGQIRVYISHQKRQDAYAAGRRRFVKLGMIHTRHRNAVLLYFVPLTHKFAVIGGTAIHEKCGQPFWEEVVEQMTPLLKSGEFTEAVIEGVTRAGNVLAEHFPRQPDDTNELPDKVIEE